MQLQAIWPIALVMVVLTALIVYVVVHFRGSSIVALAPLDGERVLLELDGVTLRIVTASEVEVLRNHGFVRVTDKRVIVGSGSVCDRDRLGRVHFVAMLDGRGFGRGIHRDRFITFPARRGQVERNERSVRVLTPPGIAGFEIPSSIVIVAHDEPEASELLAAIVHRRPPPVRAELH